MPPIASVTVCFSLRAAARVPEMSVPLVPPHQCSIPELSPTEAPETTQCRGKTERKWSLHLIGFLFLSSVLFSASSNPAPSSGLTPALRPTLVHVAALAHGTFNSSRQLSCHLTSQSVSYPHPFPAHALPGPSTDSGGMHSHSLAQSTSLASLWAATCLAPCSLCVLAHLTSSPTQAHSVP